MAEIKQADSNCLSDESWKKLKPLGKLIPCRFMVRAKGGVRKCPDGCDRC